MQSTIKRCLFSKLIKVKSNVDKSYCYDGVSQQLRAPDFCLRMHSQLSQIVLWLLLLLISLTVCFILYLHFVLRNNTWISFKLFNFLLLNSRLCLRAAGSFSGNEYNLTDSFISFIKLRWIHQSSRICIFKTHTRIFINLEYSLLLESMIVPKHLYLLNVSPIILISSYHTKLFISKQMPFLNLWEEKSYLSFVSIIIIAYSWTACAINSKTG